MARTIKHVVRRDGVYQYQRRVPKKVMDLAAQFDAFWEETRSSGGRRS